MTQGELLTRLSSAELAEWRAFAKLEPFGEERADVRAALVCSVLANINRDSKTKPEPFTISDFLLKFEVQEEQAEEEDDEAELLRRNEALAARMRAAFLALGAVDKRESVPKATV